MRRRGLRAPTRAASEEDYSENFEDDSMSRATSQRAPSREPRQSESRFHQNFIMIS